MDTTNCKKDISCQTNRDITRWIVRLHEQGYELDFRLKDPYGLCCVQDNTYHSIEQSSVCLIDVMFDVLTRTFKYLHTVECGSGCKGLLLLDRIATLL